MKGMAMNILQNLIEMYNHLPPDSTYREVLRLILINLREAADATVYDLAELTCSSRTTISRLLDKLGYGSYAEFHEALRQAVRNYTYYNRMLPRLPDSADLLQEIHRQADSAAMLDSGDLTEASLREMAGILHAARQVFFYTPASRSVTSLQQNLAMAGIDTLSMMILPEMLQSAEKADQESILFCRTIEHAETQDLTALFEAFRAKGTVVYMFGNGNTRYADYVDRFLLKDCSAEGVIGMLLSDELYFYALSETFRRIYLH